MKICDNDILGHFVHNLQVVELVQVASSDGAEAMDQENGSSHQTAVIEALVLKQHVE